MQRFNRDHDNNRNHRTASFQNSEVYFNKKTTTRQLTTIPFVDTVIIHYTNDYFMFIIRRGSVKAITFATINYVINEWIHNFPVSKRPLLSWWWSLYKWVHHLSLRHWRKVRYATVSKSMQIPICKPNDNNHSTKTNPKRKRNILFCYNLSFE